ncbi:MAG: RES domain-containing protein [Devosia sp.]
MPTDVARASNQKLARKWAPAFYDHPSSPDGIIYPSRLNGQINLAISDSAVAKVEVKRKIPLMAAPGLPKLLDLFQIGLVG